MRLCPTHIVFALLLARGAFGLPTSPTLPADAPASNSIGDITTDGRCVWVATAEGLSRTCDEGLTWDHFLAGWSFSAMCFAFGRLFVAASHDIEIAGEAIPKGDGIFICRTDSEQIEWEHKTPWQLSYNAMLSYDLCVVPAGDDTILWSANWYGGLAKSTDWGETWTNVLWDYVFSEDSISVGDSGVTKDTLIDTTQINDFGTDNHYHHDRLVFAVSADTAADPPLVFVGTALGIYAIEDTFFWRASPEDGLLGSWCVALAVQYMPSGERIVWAASRSTNESEGDGICFSTDGGRTWDTLATGLMCWNFAFCGSTAYFACEQGLYRSDGLSAPEYVPVVSDEIRLPLDQMISVASVGGGLWVGSDFGLAFSPSCGSDEFTILIHRPSVPERSETYAFPSPFSPTQHGTIFFVFDNPTAGEATLTIFDFALKPVATITKTLPAGEKEMFQWDGTKPDGSYPANGIYHYRITLPDGRELWGKFALLK